METYWTEGITLDMSDNGGMNMKAYVRGISPNIGIKLWDPEGEGTKLDINLEDFNNDVPQMERLLIDVNNFANKSVLLRIDDLPDNFDLNASVFLDDSNEEDSSLVGNITFESNKPLGSIYALVEDETSQSKLELAVPCTESQDSCTALPEVIKLDVSLGDKIDVNFNSSSAPSRVILGLDSGNVTDMDLAWTHGIVLRQNDEGNALRLYLEGTVTSAILTTDFGRN